MKRHVMCGIAVLFVVGAAAAWGQNGLPDECEGSSVIIGLPGDAVVNFTVDLDDFTRLKERFGDSDPGWFGGDFDLDGDADLDDFVAMKSHFGQQWDMFSIPDLNCDGDVDLADVAIVQNDGLYGTRVCLPYCAIGAAGDVPEPVASSCETMMIGVLGDADRDLDVDLDDYAILKTCFGVGTTWTEGDFDWDLDVDLDDFAALKNHFGETVELWSPIDYDFDGDGDWDLDDLVIWHNSYGREVCVTYVGDGGFGVPEPASVSLLALGALACLRRRR